MNINSYDHLRIRVIAGNGHFAANKHFFSVERNDELSADDVMPPEISQMNGLISRLIGFYGGERFHIISRQ